MYLLEIMSCHAGSDVDNISFAENSNAGKSGLPDLLFQKPSEHCFPMQLSEARCNANISTFVGGQKRSCEYHSSQPKCGKWRRHACASAKETWDRSSVHFPFSITSLLQVTTNTQSRNFTPGWLSTEEICLVLSK